MSAKRATGSAAPSVQKWIIDFDVESQLRSKELKLRLQDKDPLAHGSIELFLRCPNITVIGRGNDQPFGMCYSLLRVDLSGCPNLESIPKMAFASCCYLVGWHSVSTAILRI